MTTTLAYVLTMDGAVIAMTLTVDDAIALVEGRRRSDAAWAIESEYLINGQRVHVDVSDVELMSFGVWS